MLDNNNIIAHNHHTNYNPSFYIYLYIYNVTRSDLAVLDIYESLKMYPSVDFGEYGNHEGMDMSSFLEAVEMLGLREGVEVSLRLGLKRSTCSCSILSTVLILSHDKWCTRQL